MQIHVHTARLARLRAFAASARCPHCGDLMVAPISSEFVEGGEIRHHWECDACGQTSSTSIPLTTH
jgi:transcription elongation factor Elf1